MNKVTLRRSLCLLLSVLLLFSVFPLRSLAIDPSPPDAAAPEDCTGEAAAGEDAAESEEAAAEPDVILDGDVMPLSAGNNIWFQGYVYRVNEDAAAYTKTYTLTDGAHTMRLHHLYIMRLKVDGTYKVAYCLEPDTSAYSGVDYGSGSNVNVAGEWYAHLTRYQRQGVGLAMLYSSAHHPDTLTTAESVEWEVATQVIIWEIVMGMRSEVAPYACGDSSLIDLFTGGKGARYNNKSSDSYLTGIRAKYDTISRELSLHAVIPSFTAERAAPAPTHSLTRQADGSFSATLTDTNGVLPNYDFASQSPVTLRQDGNTLTVTAPAGSLGSTLTFRASRLLPNPESDSCLFRVFYLDEKNQAMISPPDKNNIPYDPVPAYFKLELENPGTATIQKTAEGGDVADYCFKLYHWESNTAWYGKSDDSGIVYTIEGNSGDLCAQRQYPIGYYEILGYGTPNY